jgi:biotin-(acetyl-CoA carboxylase) ligase
LEAGRSFSRLEVLVSLLKRLERHYNRLQEEGPAFIITRFTEISSYARGKHVRVSEGNEVLTGVTQGLTPEGVLLLRRENGITEKVISGQVRSA